MVKIIIIRQELEWKSVEDPFNEKKKEKNQYFIVSFH